MSRGGRISCLSDRLIELLIDRPSLSYSPTLHKIFCKIMLYSKVIFKSLTGPDDTGQINIPRHERVKLHLLLLSHSEAALYSAMQLEEKSFDNYKMENHNQCFVISKHIKECLLMDISMHCIEIIKIQNIGYQDIQS